MRITKTMINYNIKNHYKAHILSCNNEIFTERYLPAIVKMRIFSWARKFLEIDILDEEAAKKINKEDLQAFKIKLEGQQRANIFEKLIAIALQELHDEYTQKKIEAEGWKTAMMQDMIHYEQEEFDDIYAQCYRIKMTLKCIEKLML